MSYNRYPNVLLTMQRYKPEVVYANKLATTYKFALFC